MTTPLRTVLGSAALIAGAALAAPAAAQTGGGWGQAPRPEAGRATPEARVARLFKRFDVNRDGFVDQREVRRARAVRFSRVDRNRDGLIQPAELRAAGRPEAAARLARGGLRLDRNADRALSPQELASGRRAQRMARRLARLDLDGDGRIAYREALAAMARGRGARAGGPPAPRFDGGGGALQ